MKQVPFIAYETKALAPIFKVCSQPFTFMIDDNIWGWLFPLIGSVENTQLDVLYRKVS